MFSIVILESRYVVNVGLYYTDNNSEFKLYAIGYDCPDIIPRIAAPPESIDYKINNETIDDIRNSRTVIIYANSDKPQGSSITVTGEEFRFFTPTDNEITDVTISFRLTESSRESLIDALLQLKEFQDRLVAAHSEWDKRNHTSS